MTDSKTNEVVEAMARAAFESDGTRIAWRDLAPLFQDIHRVRARAALTASEPLLAQARSQAVEDAAKGAIPLAFYQWLYTVEKDVRVWDLTPNEIARLIAALAQSEGEGKA